ncbi:MAG: Mo-dependent nitrogenase C-terminal domain-containing protein [Nostoc sp. DedQUE08]|uniref:Mo-dependent nitrogenase C-terminal domain-containing protein n=1 Tax=unclassified Nostoc TaxID=2593658 RepID=UPI002AD20569|nr:MULTISPECIES: Mo-dependent nitrogenase C-terminal domain-containing protein [unclassified Nostoc]MDZ8030327.1 Mo-dependent nitrogenase C-terminal domain-containing protein [Nostoc sp. DedSLP04]MDZ8064289.1 Mo-dependent nitrogenase C-terminal domain-containing protein [Nostoc sp. DedQUE08]MDZ8093573.1 Mo-dependent nitrogenase C-terminal domain-containing protein [Nostoc sp. DedQUE05]MDZ8133434.1 Mo-dependent nitrogenase C-terminal domain-containing protein [Nostoc sp. DedQUE07]MDZ8135542.1 M
MNFLNKANLDNSLLNQIRDRLESVEIHNSNLARLLCKIIPSNCPFERTVKVFGRTLLRIPPMCKLNPLYEQIVGLRFKCLLYLVNECGEDARKYC